jgi:carboxypeptidase Taq
MPAYQELIKRLREAQVLASVAELLGWDQETVMPRKAAPFRAEELALLSTLVHERATHAELGQLLATCEADADLCADPTEAANLREIRRTYDRSVKLPVELVAEIAETNSLAMEAWKDARHERDFDRFLPWLEKQLELNRRKAECWGIPEGGEAYDALLEDYEPETTSTVLERIFEPLREELTALIEAVADAPRKPDDSAFRVELSQDDQHALNVAVLERIGFDGEAGRLDTSAHPFSVGLGPGDTRITTRYRSDALLDGLSSTMHEAGHALYEQGLPKGERVGQPLSEPLGLGIHESQSRLWENHVGRSREFCRWVAPELRRLFDGQMKHVSDDDLYAAVNIVRPNLIRVESDEATYHLHIMLRFDLERSMLRGDLRPADLPGAWNERVVRDLGLDVPDDGQGCLQDLHWSMGAIGYFPTYTLGSLYAAQLWDAAVEALPGLGDEIAGGEFGALLDWLRENVHRHGRRYSATELCRRVTGRPLEHQPLMRHLNDKLRPLYGIETT